MLRFESRLGRCSRITWLSACLLALAACSDDDGSSPGAEGTAVDGGSGGKSGSGGAAGAAGMSEVKPCVPKPAAKPSPMRCSSDASTGLPPCEQWTKVEPEGAVCGNGSQYKFFVNFTQRSDNLEIMFEPGGACWDYESCTGGARGAANPNGIPDDHLAEYQYLNLLRRSDDNPAKDFNMVWVSYCTGDVHAGDKVATYENPNGGSALTYRHAGLANSQAVIDYLKPLFPDVPQLLVTGCSAGGIGAMQNYAFVREALPGAQCGYLLDDSGPAFHSEGNAMQIQNTVRTAWNLDTLFAKLEEATKVPASEFAGDFARLNTAVADRYPSDRIALTAFRKDFNYSLYSYERFFPNSTPDDIHRFFWEDLQALLKTYDTRKNLGYYVPYFRHDNCSHCTSIPPIDHDTETILSTPWLGSEIGGKALRDYVAQLLDDTKPLEKIVEPERPDANFTDEELMSCLTPTSGD
jgi:hypothetical protein